MKGNKSKARIIALAVLIFFIIDMCLIFIPSILGHAEEEIKTYVNVALDGKNLESDVLPFIVGQRTIVPVRMIMEALDADVSWDGTSRKVTVKSADKLLELYAGNTTAYVNGKKTELDVSAQIRYNRVFIPLRFISENMGLKVEWRGADKTVLLTSSKPTEVTVKSDFNFTGADIEDDQAVFTFSDNPSVYKDMKFTSPDRLVIDIEGCINKLVSYSFAGNEYISAFRWSQFTVEPNAVRLVLPLNSGVKYSVSASGNKIIVKFTKDNSSGISDKNDNKNENDNKDDNKDDKTDNNSTSGNKDNKKITIVIDPGHGGTDPGACGYDDSGKVVMKEKDPNLKISLYLYDLLKTGGFDVYLTRNTDIFVDLLPRAQMANNLNADYFVSIHNNANENLSTRGTMVMYAYDEPKKGQTLSGRQMAQIVQNHVVKAIPGTTDFGPVKNSALAVLKRTNMPAVIVESLFVSNEEDRALLANDEILKNIAQAVYDAISEIIKL